MRHAVVHTLTPTHSWMQTSVLIHSCSLVRVIWWLAECLYCCFLATSCSFIFSSQPYFLGQVNVPLQLSWQQISVLLRGLSSQHYRLGMCVYMSWVCVCVGAFSLWAWRPCWEDMDTHTVLLPPLKTLTVHHNMYGIKVFWEKIQHFMCI